MSETLYHRIYEVVRQIPPGRVATYGQVATVVGPPVTARQVGEALAALRHAHPDPSPAPGQRHARVGGHPVSWLWPSARMKSALGKANQLEGLDAYCHSGRWARTFCEMSNDVRRHETSK